MSRDTTVIPFRQPEAIDDPLSELAREGARRMLAQVLISQCSAGKSKKASSASRSLVRQATALSCLAQSRYQPVCGLDSASLKRPHV